MEKHETVRKMTDGQKNDIIATMVGAIPSLTFDEAQGIIGGKGPFVVEIGGVFERRRKNIAVAKIPHYADGEEFEMTLQPEPVRAIDMVANDGYGNSKEWRFTGTEITEPQTRRFKWQAVGYWQNFDEVLEKLKPHGNIPEGQWREAVKEIFQPDGQHTRGIPDFSWVSPRGGARFPCVYEDGSSRFCWTGDGFVESWRWLVAVGK